MARKIKTYPIADGQHQLIKKKMLKWCEPFSIFSFLDSNGNKDKNGAYECLVGAGVNEKVQLSNGLDALSIFHQQHKDWLFGHIGYDYKNVLHHNLSSVNNCSTNFEDAFFFVPRVVLHINYACDTLTIESEDDIDEVYDAILNCNISDKAVLPKVTFNSKTTKEKYLSTVEALRSHIKRGDCYEINYCNEFYANDVDVSPLDVYWALSDISKAPFSAMYKVEGQYMMCASPERYLRKKNDKILSQPIKGTSSRYINPDEDKASKEQLYNSIKERAENVMITDLVRNDIARSCKVGSVDVEELFGVYSFQQVHQMISTVTGSLGSHQIFSDAIKFSFPMGSMTGAPKYKVMQLIDEYEDVARGLFSGTVGYISPNADFDFNVIIRSLFYNSETKVLTFQAGGAITYDSEADKEWDEMRLKGRAMEKIFS